MLIIGGAPSCSMRFQQRRRHHHHNNRGIVVVSSGSSSNTKQLLRRSVGPPPLLQMIRAASISAVSVALTLQMLTVDSSGAMETLENVPQTLSSTDNKAQPRIQKPKSRKAEVCTLKCLTTCIRGGSGSPGEGPLNIRRQASSGFQARIPESSILFGGVL